MNQLSYRNGGTTVMAPRFSPMNFHHQGIAMWNSWYLAVGLVGSPFKKKKEMDLSWSTRSGCPYGYKLTLTLVIWTPSDVCKKCVSRSLYWFQRRLLYGDSLWGHRKFWNIVPTISAHNIFIYMIYNMYLSLMNLCKLGVHRSLGETHMTVARRYRIMNPYWTVLNMKTRPKWQSGDMWTCTLW